MPGQREGNGSDLYLKSNAVHFQQHLQREENDEEDVGRLCKMMSRREHVMNTVQGV